MNIDPATLIGLKEDVVLRMLSRLGVEHRVGFRDGVAVPVKKNKSKLRLDVQAGTVTKVHVV